MVRHFNVICDKFDVVNVCSSGKLYRKLSLNLILLQFFFSMAQQSLVGQGLLIHTQLYTPHSVGLLWTSDQPDAETST
jgi:hypothetical protein